MDKISLPDDILHFLTTFLSTEDCMSLCLSSIFKRSIDFYSRRRVWNLSRRFSLKPDICQAFFSTCLKTSNVQVLDFSHCFWLPDAILLQSCLSSDLKNLKELSIADTQLSLVLVVLHVFPQCPSLIKLSVNILEPTWEAFSDKIQEVAYNYKENFKKLKHLKFYTLDSSSPSVWLLLFNVLGWCRDCVQLHINLFEPQGVNENFDSENDEASNNVVSLARANLYDTFKWMISLKSICILKKTSDKCLDDFCHWLLLELNPPDLETIWIQSVDSFGSKYKPKPMLSCFYLGSTPLPRTFFSQMTHLIGVILSCNSILPRLRFFRGNFSSYSVLDEFCLNHPKLEHLQFEDRVFGGSRRKKPIIFLHHWVLAQLRTLIFDRKRPHQDVLDKFMDSCSNLEEVHVGRYHYYGTWLFSRQTPVEDCFDCLAKQTHMRKLSLNSIEFRYGSFIEKVLENCHKLESLHLAGQFTIGWVNFHNDLCKYLPLAKHLRDLRIQREEMTNSVLLDLISAAGSCPSLERLMIRQYKGDGNNNQHLHSTLPQCLINLVSVQLPRLLAFCLIFELKSETVKAITRAFQETILPNRPSFWFFIDKTLPNGINDPRVHLDEIVKPHIDSFPLNNLD